MSEQPEMYSVCFDPKTTSIGPVRVQPSASRALVTFTDKGVTFPDDLTLEEAKYVIRTLAKLVPVVGEWR